MNEGLVEYWDLLSYCFVLYAVGKFGGPKANFEFQNVKEQHKLVIISLKVSAS